MPERMTAKKVRIADISSGEWMQQDGMEPSYVVAKTGERVSRARILATIVSKFQSEDGNFGSLTVDDGTDTIRAKCFKDMTPIAKAEIGHLVDMIGKVREYNGEIYVMPEVMKKVADPNLLLLRKLEIIKRSRDLKASGAAEPKTEVSQSVSNTDKPKAVDGASKPAEPIEAPATAKPAGENLRKKLLDIIGGSKDGIEYAGLIEKSGQTEDKVDAVVNELLAEGICYEPTPGKIRKI